MKLSKTKKILLLGTTLAILTTSVVTPIVLLNKNENNQENNVEKISKILKAKTTKEKVIELSNSANGKIIADNQDKIIEKIKALIGKANLKEVKIEILMQKDTNISTTTKKIIIKLTKNEVSKKIEGFSVKKQSIIDVNKDITAIKNILDAKSGNDLIITLQNNSIGNIIGNRINKIAIIKKIIMLIDPSNTNAEGTHASLRGTSIQVSMNVDAPISTTPQNIIVSISKTNGTTVTTTKTFQVKRDFTPDEDIQAIKEIFDAKTSDDRIIRLPSDSTGSIIDNLINKNAIERKIRMLIDPSNTSGDPNHSSLRGTTITLIKVDLDSAYPKNDLISTFVKLIVIKISKTGGTSVDYGNIGVQKL